MGLARQELVTPRKENCLEPKWIEPRSGGALAGRHSSITSVSILTERDAEEDAMTRKEEQVHDLGATAVALPICSLYISSWWLFFMSSVRLLRLILARLCCHPCTGPFHSSSLLATCGVRNMELRLDFCKKHAKVFRWILAFS